MKDDSAKSPGSLTGLRQSLLITGIPGSGKTYVA
jgi:hypothetical protein